tara:strand:- start:24843 stop:25547 length:705 start_codon:yes stop_codon:yes gene_type:complete
MDNLTIILKVEERLNKLSSNDYDNILKWQIVEAFNKGVIDWCRRQLHGTNLKQTGDEQSKRRIDDLQVLLRDHPLDMEKKDGYYGSTNWPENYLEYKRVSIVGKTECCEAKKGWVLTLVEEANIDVILNDTLKKPNFNWRHTVVTLMNNVVKVWTNDEFEVPKATLTYYKQPRRIEIQGVSNPYTGIISTADVISEFKDDIVEIYIDECVKILSGDIESMSSEQIADKSVESNN